MVYDNEAEGSGAQFPFCERLLMSQEVDVGVVHAGIPYVKLLQDGSTSCPLVRMADLPKFADLGFVIGTPEKKFNLSGSVKASMSAAQILWRSGSRTHMEKILRKRYHWQVDCHTPMSYITLQRMWYSLHLHQMAHIILISAFVNAFAM